MPEEKEPCRRSNRHRPPTTYKENDDDDPHDDDHDEDYDPHDDDDDDERKITQNVRYLAKHPEKVAAYKKWYRETHGAQFAEAQKRYRETHREQWRAYQRQYRMTHREQERQRYTTDKYQAYRRHYLANKRKRDKEKKRKVEKLKSLGPLKLTITLKDYLKSPSGRTPVTTYFISFCQSLKPSVETAVESFLQLLENEDPDSWTLTSLDSGDIQTVEPPVWDPSSSEDSGCDMLSDDLSSLQDLLEDMSPDDWVQVMEDVVEPFDLDAFDLDTFVSLTPEDIVDVSIDDGTQQGKDVMEPSDLDAFVS